MEPRREGTSCHKELRSGRVVAVGVNSIGEEINVRKVIPPGFIMILWEEKETVSTTREEPERTGMASSLCHLMSHTGPHGNCLTVPTEQNEELLR